MNGINILLLSGPLCWGIYEIRKLRKLLENYKTTIDTLSPKVISTTNMINDIAKEDLDNYPFIMKLKLLVDKSNRILH
jgi:hypothetical protein